MQQAPGCIPGKARSKIKAIAPPTNMFIDSRIRNVSSSTELPADQKKNKTFSLIYCRFRFYASVGKSEANENA